MKTLRKSALLLTCMFIVFAGGCADELQDLKVRNATQDKVIKELRSELQAAKLRLEQLQQQQSAGLAKNAVEIETLQQKIAALEKNLADKNALISSMQQQLLYGGTQLPVELSTLLEDFAAKEQMVTFDPARGVVKFKSDLLFEKGSDIVTPIASQAIVSLCQILNTEQGKKFDVIVAGHTDDIKIGKPETLAKHPSNWHLSAHRAISVLNIMAQNNIEPVRLSARGFGEYRPVESNMPDKKGNPMNRRVEIYIVAKGI